MEEVVTREELMSMVARVTSENAQLTAQLGVVQERCKVLLEEARAGRLLAQRLLIAKPLDEPEAIINDLNAIRAWAEKPL